MKNYAKVCRIKQNFKDACIYIQKYAEVGRGMQKYNNNTIQEVNSFIKVSKLTKSLKH